MSKQFVRRRFENCQTWSGDRGSRTDHFRADARQEHLIAFQTAQGEEIVFGHAFREIDRFPWRGGSYKEDGNRDRSAEQHPPGMAHPHICHSLCLVERFYHLVFGESRGLRNGGSS